MSWQGPLSGASPRAQTGSLPAVLPSGLSTPEADPPQEMGEEIGTEQLLRVPRTHRQEAVHSVWEDLLSWKRLSPRQCVPVLRALQEDLPTGRLWGIWPVGTAGPAAVL